MDNLVKGAQNSQLLNIAVDLLCNGSIYWESLGIEKLHCCKRGKEYQAKQ